MAIVCDRGLLWRHCDFHFHDLYISSDEKVFNKILTCPNHILRTLLPPPTAQIITVLERDLTIDSYLE